MNSITLLQRASALFSLCTILSAAELDHSLLPPAAAVSSQTNGLQNAAVPTQTVQVVVPELNQLRTQLREMERSNEEMRKSSEQAQKASEQASQKFEHMSQQNTALSNVLIGLQQTLIAQREREIELARQSTSFQFKVIIGAAAAVFLVLLFSYWFQLRCLNRVMEIKTGGLLPGGRAPHLLEPENPQTSKLLSAMKMLEHRMEQLETPGQHAAAAPTLVDNTGVEPSTSSSMSLLLAKGQVLLDTERLQEAVACFQEAITVDPENSEAHLKKGIALERMGRMEQALAAYEEALRLNPKRTVANVYKARVLAAMHRYDEAISTYDNALGRNSGKVETPIFAS